MSHGIILSMLSSVCNDVVLFMFQSISSIIPRDGTITDVTDMIIDRSHLETSSRTFIFIQNIIYRVFATATRNV